MKILSPKAKPFRFDNSANENAIDWILDQLPERTRFVSRLHALPLLHFLSFSAPASALVPHSAMTLHVLTPPLPYLSHLRSAAMGLPYSSEPGRFPQWHRLEAVLEGPETENWPVLQLFCD